MSLKHIFQTFALWLALGAVAGAQERGTGTSGSVGAASSSQTNLVATNAVYDGTGLYTIATKVGATYWLVIGGTGANHFNNDAGISNGTARVLANGSFIASNSTTTVISSKIISGSNPGPGKPVGTAIYLVTSPPLYQVYDPSMYSLARNYGITGVGDETAKLTNAFHSSPKILLVDISFSITNATIPNGFTLLGDGHSTITQLTNAVGDMLVAGQTVNVTCKNLILSGQAYGQAGNGGGGPAYNWSAINSQVTQGASIIRNGLHVDGVTSSSVIQNCTISGFSGAGIALDGYGASFPQALGALVDGANISSCWQGIVSSNGGEYCQIHNSFVSGCGHGVEIASGNMKVTGIAGMHNGVAIYLNGDVNNPAHGLVADCMLNHNTIAIEAIDVPNGETFNNIEVLGVNALDSGAVNGILLTNCFGVVFDGGYWNSTMTVTNSGGGTNRLRNINSLGYFTLANVNGGTMLNNGVFNVAGSTIETNNLTTAYTVPPIFQATNAAPANVTIGTTAPDGWFKWTNNNGVLMVSPGWSTTH